MAKTQSTKKQKEDKRPVLSGPVLFAYANSFINGTDAGLIKASEVETTIK